jgi:hypothetical protein
MLQVGGTGIRRDTDVYGLKAPQSVAVFDRRARKSPHADKGAGPPRRGNGPSPMGCAAAVRLPTLPELYRPVTPCADALCHCAHRLCPKA